ncbi:nitrogen regulation protein NR(II) [Egicoccus sp. AB-alg2]|uniref:two-component system sensor histidine kinase NtrB n=1 Tax=Egicoccus sp. AB-alg2 TaxID=3242693 RepID=UPI00359D9321
MTRILLLEPDTGTVAEAAAGTDGGLRFVADVEQCLDLLRHAQPRPELVAIGSSCRRPLSAARSIRRADSAIGLALVVPPEQVTTARTRLALAPELTNVVVVAGPPDGRQLRLTLDRAASTAVRRRRVRRALDAINRDVLGPSPAPPQAEPTTVSEQYLAALVHHAPDAILSVTPEGRVVTLNDTGEQVLGVSVAEAEGRPLHELLRDGTRQQVEALLRTATEARAQVRDEFRLERDREPLLLAVTAAPMLDDGADIVGHVVIARDITRERRSEERLRNLQQAESLATLAGGVAHDFNNLLVGMQGWATIARDRLDDPQLVEHALSQILEATGRAAELARSMLAYGGRGSIEFSRVHLDELVTGMARLLQSSIPRTTELTVDAGPDLPTLHADPTQLRQVLMNLVINAGEAIGDRPGHVHVRTRTTTVGPRQAETHPTGALRPGRYVVIEVEDDGPGIPDDVRERLFDPFFSTKFAGRGLGLAASSGIVAAHGGAIDVDSVPGRGTRFRVLLPVPRAGT